MSRRPEPLYDKKHTCLFCGQPFKSKRVRSSSQRVLKRDSDFCTHTEDPALNPILYAVAVCPTCGFAFTDMFSKTLSPDAQKRVEQEVASRWVTKDLGNVRTFAEAEAAYKLALYSAELTEQPAIVKASLALRLAWLYRFQSREAEEQRFLRLAVAHYEESYVRSDYLRGDKGMSEVRLLYLIGELYRRIGQLEQAVQYFSRVTALKNQTTETGIVQMAREQWSLAREEFARLKGSSAD